MLTFRFEPPITIVQYIRCAQSRYFISYLHVFAADQSDGNHFGTKDQFTEIHYSIKVAIAPGV